MQAIYFVEQSPVQNRLIFFDHSNLEVDFLGTDRVKRMRIGRYIGNHQIVLPDLNVFKIAHAGYFWCYANVMVDQPATFI